MLYHIYQLLGEGQKYIFYPRCADHYEGLEEYPNDQPRLDLEITSKTLTVHRTRLKGSLGWQRDTRVDSLEHANSWLQVKESGAFRKEKVCR